METAVKGTYERRIEHLASVLLDDEKATRVMFRTTADCFPQLKITTPITSFRLPPSVARLEAPIIVKCYGNGKFPPVIIGSLQCDQGRIEALRTVREHQGDSDVYLDTHEFLLRIPLSKKTGVHIADIRVLGTNHDTLAKTALSWEELAPLAVSPTALRFQRGKVGIESSLMVTSSDKRPFKVLRIRGMPSWLRCNGIADTPATNHQMRFSVLEAITSFKDKLVQFELQTDHPLQKSVHVPVLLYEN